MTESVNMIRSSLAFGPGSNGNHTMMNPPGRSIAGKYHNEELSPRDVNRTIEALKNYVRSNMKSLDISVDDRTDMIIVKVISQEDGRVIREIPSEECVDLAARMKWLEGLFIDRIV